MNPCKIASKNVESYTWMVFRMQNVTTISVRSSCRVAQIPPPHGECYIRRANPTKNSLSLQTCRSKPRSTMRHFLIRYRVLLRQRIVLDSVIDENNIYCQHGLMMLVVLRLALGILHTLKQWVARQTKQPLRLMQLSILRRLPTVLPALWTQNAASKSRSLLNASLTCDFSGSYWWVAARLHSATVPPRLALNMVEFSDQSI